MSGRVSGMSLLLGPTPLAGDPELGIHCTATPPPHSGTEIATPCSDVMYYWTPVLATLFLFAKKVAMLAFL